MDDDADGSGSGLHDASTLFLRNLGPGTKEEELKSWLVAVVGPVRRLVVVYEKEEEGGGMAASATEKSRRCRGFAFVQFAMRQDVEKACEMLNGADFGGRKLKVDRAKRRVRKGGREGKRGEEPVNTMEEVKTEKKRDNEARDAGTKDGDEKKLSVTAPSKRTVLVSIKQSDNKDDIGGDMDREKASEELRSLLLSLPGADASMLSFVPDGHFRCQFAHLREAREALFKVHKHTLGCGKFETDARMEAFQNTKRARLIVRNLPFRIGDDDVRQAFSLAGPIREIQIPKDHKGKVQGFGFVEYFIPGDARAAVSRVNGTLLGGRVIAVDHALAKDAYQNAKRKKDVSNDDRTENAEDGANPSPEPDDDVDSLDGDAARRKTTRKADTSTEEELQRTVFVRNVLYETTKMDLRDIMMEVGKVEQCVLTTDPISKRPRGSGFVRFRNKVDAEELLSRAGPTGLDAGISLHGRSLRFSPALEKDEAREKSVDKSGKRKNHDTRNRHLAEIGFIAQDSEEGRSLSAEDLSKRMKAQKEMREKLVKNPNTFVSTTRLSIRNLPKELDDKDLKTMFANVIGGTKSIVQAKIVRNDEGRNGAPRSKGYGFVEFKGHDETLKALHAVNNNPRAFEEYLPDATELRKRSDRRLIVSFAIEDKRKLLILEKVKQRGKEKGGQKRSQADLEQEQTEGDSRKVSRAKKHTKQAVAPPTTEGRRRRMDRRLPAKKMKTQPVGKQTKWTNGDAVFKGKRGGPQKSPAPTRVKDQTRERVEPRPKKRTRLNPEDSKFERLLHQYRAALQTTAN